MAIGGGLTAHRSAADLIFPMRFCGKTVAGKLYRADGVQFSATRGSAQVSKMKHGCDWRAVGWYNVFQNGSLC